MRSGRFLIVLLALALPVSARAQSATIEVENHLDRDLLVWINGEPRGVAPANERVDFQPVPEGPVTLMASGVDGTGIEASERRVLAGGESFTWILSPIPVLGEEKGTGMLVVTNLRDEAVQVMAGGGILGWISASGTRSFPRLVAGTVPVERGTPPRTWSR